MRSGCCKMLSNALLTYYQLSLHQRAHFPEEKTGPPGDFDAQWCARAQPQQDVNASLPHCQVTGETNKWASIMEQRDNMQDTGNSCDSAPSLFRYCVEHNNLHFLLFNPT